MWRPKTTISGVHSFEIKVADKAKLLGVEIGKHTDGKDQVHKVKVNLKRAQVCIAIGAGVDILVHLGGNMTRLNKTIAALGAPKYLQISPILMDTLGQTPSIPSGWGRLRAPPASRQRGRGAR